MMRHLKFSLFTQYEKRRGIVREWVDHTVARIRQLQPRRILEIGCGTGLLLYRLAPHCQSYIGTDFLASSVAKVRREVEKQPYADRVTLFEQTAAARPDYKVFDLTNATPLIQRVYADGCPAPDSSSCSISSRRPYSA